MLFPEVRPFRKPAVDEIKHALESDAASIYLDANVLIHCYEMNALASEDLLRTLERYGDRVHVPLWAARETWVHLKDLNSAKPLRKLADKIRNSLERFRAETTRYLDDDAVPGMSRDDYQLQLGDAVTAANDLMQRVANYEPKIDQTTARLLPFIEARRLASNLQPIFAEVSHTAAARVAHKVPPGFRDASSAAAEEVDEDPPAQGRRGKAFNPHGDLISWLEILADCHARDIEQLIVVTRDVTKGDWVYSPRIVLNEKGQPQANNHLLTLPHPLLAQEAMGRCPAVKGVHVITVEMLAHIWNDMGIDVGNLVAALQPVSAAADTPPVVNTVPSDPPDGTDYVARFGSEDTYYEPNPENDLDQLIIDLDSDGWTAQNEALRRLENQLASLSRAQRIQIGRGVVSAANEGAREPSEFLERVLENEALGRALRSDILIGVLAEIYIAVGGMPKKPVATANIIATIYNYQGHANLADAFGAVIDRLKPVRNRYLGLPRDCEMQIPLEISLQRDTLVSLSVGAVSLLEQDPPSSRAFRRRGRGLDIRAGDLVNLVAEEFLVPMHVLTTDLSPAANITLPGDLGFIEWGPETGTLLR